MAEEARLKDGDDMGEGTTPSKLWARELEQAKKANKAYWKQCDDIGQKYKGQDDGASSGDDSAIPKNRKYNVLWSVMETMKPLVYYQAPKPFVGRRFNDSDPKARDASLIIERGLSCSMDNHELHDALLDARDDYLMCSRGVIWAKYSPYMQLRQGERELPDGTTESYEYEEKVYEECEWEHVLYKDFLHGAATKWKHVPWVARRVPMDREELIKRFGDEVGKKVPLTIGCSDEFKSSGATDEEKGIFAKGEVWEIWSKRKKKVYWLCPSKPEMFLDEKDDFLDLEGFFPCPRPSMGTKTNDSLMPTPDYKLWQDIAIELDELTYRIKLLTESLRVVGVYDSSAGEVMKRLMTQTMENDMIPVDSWALFSEKGGLKGAVEFLPIEQVANVLERLHRARQALTQELYEITGLSDIVRGASDPRETAAAQKIKGNFAGKRLMPKQGEMIRMADEALEIQSEIMSKHYSDETLIMISSATEVMINDQTKQPDMNRIQAALQLIRSNMRQQRIKVDEKSLIVEDAADDQNQRGQILNGISQLLSQAVPFLQQAPAAGPLLGRLLMFGVRGYPLAKSEEHAIQLSLDQLLAAPPQPQEQEQKGPSEAELQIKREELALKREELAFKREEAEKRYNIEMAKIAAESGKDREQSQNRQIENFMRKEKQDADATIRAEQVNVQREGTGNAQKIDLAKWMGERDQADDHEALKASVEQDKLSAQSDQKRYEAAFRSKADT